MRRLTCPFDGDCSAGRPYPCAWRARSRRPHTNATCERKIDAKASSDEEVEDVNVDRCIDENSASNCGWVALVVRLSPKVHRLKLETVSESSQTSLPRTPYIFEGTKFPQSQVKGRHLSRIIYSSHQIQAMQARYIHIIYIFIRTVSQMRCLFIRTDNMI